MQKFLKILPMRENSQGHAPLPPPQKKIIPQTTMQKKFFTRPRAIKNFPNQGPCEISPSDQNFFSVNENYFKKIF